MRFLLGVQRQTGYVSNGLANTVTDALHALYKAHVELESNNDSLPLAQQRPCRIPQLPECYRDLLPEPPRLLPPVEVQGNLGGVGLLNSCLLNAPLPSSAAHVLSHPKVKFQLNSFSVFRLYDEGSLPIDNPDADELSKTTGSFSLHQGTLTNGSKGVTWLSNPFYPYPNEPSLLLGDWYWNYGYQKSQASFQKLLDIIRHPDYHPDDVRNTNWAMINQTLRSSGIPDDKNQEESEWLDGDIGWKKTTIQICIPFHHCTQNPGPKEYTVEGFHHCSLIDIIHENVSDPTHHQLLHYELYELHWKPPHKANDMRIYGELYTSKSFLTAHHQLQDSPPEPRCTLPHCIIGLMLWSDATHLATFGTAKLWLCTFMWATS